MMLDTPNVDSSQPSILVVGLFFGEAPSLSFDRSCCLAVDLIQLTRRCQVRDGFVSSQLCGSSE